MAVTLGYEVMQFAGVVKMAFRTERIGVVREMLGVTIDTPEFEVSA